MLLDRRRALAGYFLELQLEFSQVIGEHRRLDAELARGLVEEVNSLVGEEPVGYVAVRVARGGAQRLLGDLHAVVRLVLVPDTAQYLDGLLLGGLFHEDRLEAAFEGGVGSM